MFFLPFIGANHQQQSSSFFNSKIY